MRFSVFGIPVRVQPLFWLIAGFLAWQWGGYRDPWFMPVGMVVVFVSVLGHELGHALVARRFGAEVDMTLHGLGGYTRWQVEGELPPARRVVVAAAGSLTGFALGGLVWIADGAGLFGGGASTLEQAVHWFVVANFFWGALNWLPIRPLDGGHMLLGVLQAAFGRRGVAIANVIFPIVTLAGGLVAWALGYVIAALFAGFVLMEEFREWNQRSAASRPPAPAESGPFTLFGDEPAAAVEVRPGTVQGQETEPTEDDGEAAPEVG